MHVIPIYASAGVSGFESPAAEYAQLGCDLNEFLIDHPSSTFIGQAKGDSMQGVGIFDNDILIVDRYPTAQHLDIIVANINGEFVCKQFDLTKRLLLSANPKYRPVPIMEYDTFSIEGVVIRSIRCFRPCYLLD
ncbi:translesion error-prone DNA polymerase V autoproteolytic subunit [Vibrio sp. Isolate25]|uniref:LexA family protein n=1 Tax=Vibrio TaxID=662 RepID=UPI001EFEDD20|nr:MULTISPECIES: translesion error-prone DNA polymerase V autoproteolytic subunit [Vibrio]MCG9597626.1 translesion error-prone DNA polymerase V autoproteolytic subunit [Vibrio sp. Isolate25]MCG9678712.1 translesion error-prone DNA polymerase V autoproteolytic subunit [Vibrio sp. Isolate24]MCG9683061.1 translesion error-prone DNA polymerase V autoproteolytic subunit [Vibrio sp. Isolate23]USD31370.1 translesion error-prone DNA polymerase V autoproteolytic subunit [Vibrio sp. SCSIO 43186]USD44415